MQYDGVVRKPPNAYFGPLQIGENANVTPVVARLSTNVLGNKRVISLYPVTEIETKHIDACSQQATNHVLTLARGPNCRNDFCAA